MLPTAERKSKKRIIELTEPLSDIRFIREALSKRFKAETARAQVEHEIFVSGAKKSALGGLTTLVPGAVATILVSIFGYPNEPERTNSLLIGLGITAGVALITSVVTHIINKIVMSKHIDERVNAHLKDIKQEQVIAWLGQLGFSNFRSLFKEMYQAEIMQTADIEKQKVPELTEEQFDRLATELYTELTKNHLIEESHTPFFGV